MSVNDIVTSGARPLTYFAHGYFNFAHNVFMVYEGYQGDCGWVQTIRLCSPRRGGEIFLKLK